MGVNKVKTNYHFSNGFGLTAFTDEEIKTIHEATLKVLCQTGIMVENQKALEIFYAAGAKIHMEKGYGIVKIPNSMVDESIQSTPRNGLFYGRRPEDDYFTNKNSVAFTAGFGEHVRIIDPETRKIRPTTKQDLADITRIQDALNVTPVVERAACSGDQLPAAQSVHNYSAMVQNTSKHCFLGFGSRKNAEKIIEIAKIAAGGEEQLKKRPIVTGFVCPTSPLSLVNEACESIITCAESGIGIAIIAMSLSGASSPATLAGVVVQHNVEVLSALILAQLTRKGTPCVYCGCSTIMDLRLACSPVGVPEHAVLNVAWAKLAQFYQLPSLVGGCATDSKTTDAHQAYDFTLTAMPPALAGADIIFGLGAIDSVLTFDYAAMILGAEQAERILRVGNGISVSDENIAVDLIHQIGPGGEYLTHRHTFEHMREMSSAGLFNRFNRADWENKMRSKPIRELAYEKAERILKEHTPMQLPDESVKQIEALIHDYEEELKSQ